MSSIYTLYGWNQNLKTWVFLINFFKIPFRIIFALEKTYMNITKDLHISHPHLVSTIVNYC